MRVPCVGALVTDGEGRLLVVRRGRPPGVGLWSVPGGRVEPGETDEQAVRREVQEETGLLVLVGALVGRLERPGLDGQVYDIADYACELRGGSLVAGDDAAEVRWVRPEELRALATTEGLAEILAGWGVIA